VESNVEPDLIPASAKTNWEPVCRTILDCAAVELIEARDSTQASAKMSLAREWSMIPEFATPASAASIRAACGRRPTYRSATGHRMSRDSVTAWMRVETEARRR
jgi:hypothetical protein